jgi:pimeloyl-ACP methyl ester carboxylesterase
MEISIMVRCPGDALLKRALYRSGIALLLAVAVSLPAARAVEFPRQFEVMLDRPPGRLVDVGGYRLHIFCLGHGDPTVILESGLGGFSLDWIYVQTLLESETRVCAYDRAGYGWSDPGPSPRDSSQIARELGLLLKNARIAPPYILVGHSFGGFNVEYFAKRHPDLVAGLVLVDASHPDQSLRLPELPSRAGRGAGTLVTLFNPEVVRRHYPERVWFSIEALLTSSKAITTQQRELRYFNVSASEVHMSGALPQLPLVVVTRGRRVWPENPMGDALENAWAQMQLDLVASVRGARQLIARDAGHLVQLDEPGMVAHAVRLLLRERQCAAIVAQTVQAEPGSGC